MRKWVYSFGDRTSEGEAGMRKLLSVKGANFAEMCNFGFTLKGSSLIVVKAPLSISFGEIFV